MKIKSVVATGTSFASVISVGIATAFISGIGSFICRIGRRGIRFRWGLLLTVAVFITQHSFTLSATVSKPMAVVSMLGDRARIKCSRDWSDLPVDWEFAPVLSNNFSYIYTDRQIAENLTSSYKIDTDGKTRYDIVIDSVDWSHAGTYICTAVTTRVSIAPSGSSQLIVLESDPVCNSNANSSEGGIVEGNNLRMWCTLNYSGNWIPAMGWNSTTKGRFDTDSSSRSEVQVSLRTPVYSDDDGVTIAGKMDVSPKSRWVYGDPRPGEVVAKNVPDYQYLWTVKLNVLYAPKLLTIIPMRSVYEVGDRLVCRANGNPPPTYEWMEIETNRTIHGSVLTIDDQMTSDGNHSFSCTAYSTFAGVQRQIAKTITFTVNDTSVTSHAVNAVGAFAVIAMGLSVMLSVKA